MRVSSAVLMSIIVLASVSRCSGFRIPLSRLCGLRLRRLSSSEVGASDLTVAELKKILRSKGLAVSGKKDLLIERLHSQGIPLPSVKAQAISLAPQSTDRSLAALGRSLGEAWADRLANLQRPAAAALVPQLAPINALAYEPSSTVALQDGRPKSGTLLHFVNQQKAAHPNKVILVRVGDFFESYGVDAVMLVEHAGLNPMGGKPRAGCPWRNVQATIDGLVQNGGLTVAVFEELNAPELARGAKRRGIKDRFLSQVVSPGSSTYLYDMCLHGDDVDFRDSRPYAVVSFSPSEGFTLATASVDSREFSSFERLTPEALRAEVASRAPIEPLYLSPGTSPSDLPWGTSDLLTTAVVAPGMSGDKPLVVGATADTIADLLVKRLSFDLCISADTFRRTDRNAYLSALGVDSEYAPQLPPSAQPLYVSTATQLGLMETPAICSLPASLIPATAPASCLRQLRRWLLSPPPEAVADARRAVLRLLKNSKEGSLAMTPLPPLKTAVPLGKLVAMISQTQGNPPLFRDVASMLNSVLVVLGAPLLPHKLHVWSSSSTMHNTEEMDDEAASADLEKVARDWLQEVEHAASVDFEHVSESERSDYEALVNPLLLLTAHESGLPVSRAVLLRGCSRLLAKLATSVAPPSSFDHRFLDATKEADGAVAGCTTTVGSKQARISEDTEKILSEFFKQNEDPWRGFVRPGHDPNVLSACAQVAVAAQALRNVILADYANGEVKHDILNNRLLLLEKPLAKEEKKYFQPKDRFNVKVLVGKWTTERAEDARGDYLSAVARAELSVRQAIGALNSFLAADMPTLVHGAHWVSLLLTLTHHSTTAQAKGWCLPELVAFPAAAKDGGGGEKGTEEEEGFFQSPSLESDGLVPYWVGASSRDVGDGGVVPPPVGTRSNIRVSLGSSQVVANNLNLTGGGVVLLTAPNMSGKSTIMRSLASSALLANCGLFTPCRDFVCPRFDSFFVRAPGGDAPSEGKSAWALEADEMRALVRDASSRSLVMVDELGRGTSARDGAALAGALLERLDRIGCYGIFATHLHELLDLPLTLSSRTSKKRMGVDWRSNPQGTGVEPVWTYLLEEGSCCDSMALHTGRQFGLDEAVLARAAELTEAFDIVCRNTTSADAATPPPLLFSRIAKEVPEKMGGFDLVKQVLLQEARSLATAESAATKTVLLPPRWEVPQGLTAKVSCVYVLEVSAPASAAATNPSSVAYYVGETDALKQRLQQHRVRQGSTKTGEGSGVWGWADAAAMVLPVADKSMARAVEARTITALAEAGLPLLSKADGAHRHFGVSGFTASSGLTEK